MLSLGKYGANFNAFGGTGTGEERWTGKWNIYDMASGAGYPIEKGQTTEVRSTYGEAQDDARRAVLQRLRELHEADE